MANKIVWKRVRAQTCGPQYLRGYTGQWCSFTIRSNLCGRGFDMECMLPGIAIQNFATSEDDLTKKAQVIFDEWFEKLMEMEE
jgi:hypothetical protein